MNILAVTLARGGSKGVTQKNIRSLKGKPLIQYTIEEALLSKHITHYIVSTDCPTTRNIVESLGAQAPFLRPAHLSSDTATSAAALKHAVLFCESQYNLKYDIVVELMATNPFKKSHHIDSAIDKIVATNADSVIGVSKLHDHHPARIKKIENDFILDFAVPELSSRRQDLKPDAYIRNGSIYCIQRDLLVEHEYRFGGANSRPLLMPDECLVNIDTELDLHLAEAILNLQS